MIQLLKKTNMPQFRKYVWYGVFSGIAVACIAGAGIVAAYYAAQNAFMTDKDRALFSAVFSGIASVFLTVLGIQFLRFKDLQTKYRRKMSEGIQKAKQQVHCLSCCIKPASCIDGTRQTSALDSDSF
jgi:FTR1 family protein